MNNLNLSHAYEALLIAKNLFSESTMDVADVENEVAESNEELARDVELFSEWLHRSRRAAELGDANETGNALVHLRAHAMNISSIFLNLADTIEALAFTNGEKPKT